MFSNATCVRRRIAATVVVAAACFLALAWSPPEAPAATSAVIQIGPAHTLTVSASADVRPAGREDAGQFAGVSETVHRFDLVAGANAVGTLTVAVRSLPAGNVAVFSRLDAPDAAVHVDLDVRTPAGSYTLRALDPAVDPGPSATPPPDSDGITNAIGVVEMDSADEQTSALFLGKAYEFRELVKVYPEGKESRVKELLREGSDYSIGRAGSSTSAKLFLNAEHSSCERYFVVSPRPILEGELGSTDLDKLAELRFAWVDRTGPFMKAPPSIDPFTWDGYARSLRLLRAQAVTRAATKSGSPFMSDIAYSTLYSLWLLKDDDGLWRTEYTSTWVGAETGIVAPYVDTRHNELIALWLLNFADVMDVSPELDSALREMALPYADYLAEKAAAGEVIRTDSGYFFHDYYNGPGGSHSFVSLNHALGEQHYLLRTYQDTGDRRYLDAALAIRDAIRDTTPGWISPSGDLWYGMTPGGTFFDTDYPLVTLNDLVCCEEMLRTITGTEEAAYGTLIRSKVAFLNAERAATAALGPDGFVVMRQHRRLDESAPLPAAPGRSANIPVLGCTPVRGSVRSGEGSSARYSVYAPEGSIVRITLTGAPASDLDLRLFAPRAEPVVSKPVATRATNLYPETLEYTIPPGKGGEYLLEVAASWGGGAFTVSRRTRMPTHSTLADAVPAASPLLGELDEAFNERDTYAIELAPGEHIVARVVRPGGNRIGVRLLGPDATSADAPASLGPAYADRVAYTVPPGAGGTHYLDVHRLAGEGAYRVEYEVRALSAAETFPGAELPAGAPVAGTVDWAVRPNEIRWIELEAGETVHIQLERTSADAPVEAYLYAPGTTSVADRPIASARGWGTEVGVTYTVPADAGGRYPVVVQAAWGAGSYRLSVETVPGAHDTLTRTVD